MPSDLATAIRRARRQIGQEEAPIRRQLAAAYRRAVADLDADLRAVTRLIADARAAGIEPSPDWLRRQGRYRSLMAQAEAQFRRFASEGLWLVHDGQARAVAGGAATAVDLAAASGVAVQAATTFASRINTPAVERLVAALSAESPVRGVLAKYGDEAAQIIEERLLAGMIEGTGPRQIVREITRALDGPVQRARLEALVRSSMMTAFEGSLFDQYAALGVTRWVWMASLSVRSCAACVAMHGSVHPMSQPFMARHVACRCIPAPHTEYVTVERGADWFARQSVDVQRRMLPSRAVYDAYRAGRVELTDLIGYRESKVWGRSIRERSGREVLERVA